MPQVRRRVRNPSFRRENDLKDAICRRIKEAYTNDVVFFKINDACSTGYPDIFLCFFGRFVAIECKNGATAFKKHEALQNYNLSRIQRADGFGFVGRNIDTVMDSLAKIREII